MPQKFPFPCMDPSGPCRRWHLDWFSCFFSRLWPRETCICVYESALPSVLWRCWLGGRKGIRPVKNWVVTEMLVWLSVWNKVQTCIIWPSWWMPLPLTVSCFSKIQFGFAFLVPAHLGSPRKRAIKRVCVCACVRARACVCNGLPLPVLLSAVCLCVCCCQWCELVEGRVVARRRPLPCQLCHVWSHHWTHCRSVEHRSCRDLTTLHYREDWNGILAYCYPQQILDIYIVMWCWWQRVTLSFTETKVSNFCWGPKVWSDTSLICKTWSNAKLWSKCQTKSLQLSLKQM